MKLFKRTVTLLLFLIIISCVVTYFLAFYTPDNSKIKDHEINKIITLLNEHGIKANKEIIPESYPDLPTLTLINSSHERLKFAEQILGPDFSVIDSKTYTKNEKILSFNGNEFSVSFGEENLLKSNFMQANTEKYGKLIKKAVSSLGFDDDETLITVNSKENYAHVTKKISDFPIFNCEFKVTYSDHGISKINGIWFEQTADKSYKKHRPLISVFNEICENPDIKGMTITNIEAGYKTDEFTEYKKEVTAKPVWRVTFNDKIIYDYLM